MPPRKLVLAMVSGVAVFSSHPGTAQTPAAAPGVYSPKAAVQSPPLRVEVIDGTRFRDIETHEAYSSADSPGRAARWQQRGL